MKFAANTARDFLIGIIFLYGYVYAAYKYGNPLTGGNDFFKYKEMLGRPFDFSATDAPFVLRQAPVLIASIFYKLGAHYDTRTTLDLIGLDLDTKRRFFVLILSNALAICLSLTVLAGYLRIKRGGNGGMTDLFALVGIFAAWFYFPTGAIGAQTAGWGCFVSSLFVIAFVERSLALTSIATLLAVFSRESTLIFAIPLFLARLIFEVDHRRSTLSSLLVMIDLFDNAQAIYFGLRTSDRPAHHPTQLDLTSFFGRISCSVRAFAGPASNAFALYRPEVPSLCRLSFVGDRYCAGCRYWHSRESTRLG